MLPFCHATGLPASAASVTSCVDSRQIAPFGNENVRARLAEFLPDAHRGSENLEALMRTPQFQSQLERFSAALQSGQMDLAQFGLRGGTGFSVAEFLAAIQAKADEARDERNGKKDEENN